MLESQYLNLKDHLKTYYVYVLAYPKGYTDDDGTDLSDLAFYVGKGCKRVGSADRIEDHEAEARMGLRSRKCQAIRGIWDHGLQVQKLKVYETTSEKEALLREREFIKRLESPFLTNVTYNSTELAKRRNQYAAFMRRRIEEVKQEIRQAKSEVNGSSYVLPPTSQELHQVAPITIDHEQKTYRMPIIIDNEEFYSIEEACTYLGGITRDTLRRRAQAFGIQKFTRGVTKRVYYRKSDLEKLNQPRPVEDNK